MMRCMVCDKEYDEEIDSCKCNPVKYDRAMAYDDQLGVNEIDAFKTQSDKLHDGFMMLELLENDDD